MIGMFYMSQIHWRAIRKEINAYGPILLAVSGGVDSMFLLDFVSRCGVDYQVAHVNHGLRAASEQEAELVQRKTEELGAKFHYLKFDDLGTTNIESDAREKRYSFFRFIMHEYKLNRVLTGHHLNDQVETILLKLMRGNSHNKLGIERDNGFVFRPFLEIPKEVILQSATSKKLEWMDDASNFENDYERNWVRNVILPEMMTRRNVMQTIAKGLVRK